MNGRLRMRGDYDKYVCLVCIWSVLYNIGHVLEMLVFEVISLSITKSSLSLFWGKFVSKTVAIQLHTVMLKSIKSMYFSRKIRPSSYIIQISRQPVLHNRKRCGRCHFLSEMTSCSYIAIYSDFCLYKSRT